MRKGNVAREAQPLQDDTTLDIKLFSFAVLPVSTCLFCCWFYNCQLLLVFFCYVSTGRPVNTYKLLSDKMVGWLGRPATRERIINAIEPFSADSKETPLALLAISAFVLRYTSRSSTARTIRTHTDFTITLDLIAFATFMTSCTRCTST